MTILVLGLTLFIGIHLLRELGLARVLKEKLRPLTYRAGYSLIALIGLVLIIWGKSSAPFVMLWQPPFSQQWLTHMLMIPAFILVMAGNLPTSYIRVQIVNPMLLGVAIWGGAHLWSNGDLASLLLFGSFSLWSIIKLISLRNEHGSHSRPSWKWDIVAVLAGTVAYSLVLIYHGQIFGIGVIP